MEENKKENKFFSKIKDLGRKVCNSKVGKILLIVIVCVVLLNIGHNLANGSNYKSNYSDMYSGGYSYQDAMTEGMVSDKTDLNYSIQSNSSGFSFFGTSADATYNSYDSNSGVVYSDNYYSESEPEISESSSFSLDNVVEQKLVYSASVSMETKDMSDTITELKKQIKAVNGLIQSESVNNLNSYDRLDYYEFGYGVFSHSTATIYARIPQENYEDFLNGLKENDSLYIVQNLSSSVENMTDVYYDTESRLKSLRVQEDRLLDFMKNAENVTDMLSVEDRLTDVQYEIDSATNKLVTIDNDVKYAKVTLCINEVVKYTKSVDVPKTFFERVWNYIKDSGGSFASTLEDWLEAIIYLFPYLVIIVIIVFVVKNIRKSVKKKKAEKDKISIKKEETNK